MAVKKTDKSNIEDVEKKKSTSNKKKTETSKTTVKKTPSKSSKPKAKEIAVTEDKNTVEITNVENIAKNNYNPIDEVLQKKAINEEKKSLKKSKKEAKILAKAASKEIKKIVEEKGTKSPYNANKHNETKENVLKAEAKKFIELKEKTTFEESGNISYLNTFAHGYKNIFNFKGRTSRFEFWSFMLLNLLFMFICFIGIVLLAPTLGELATGILIVALSIIEMIVHLSLIVRRIHDTGNYAWRGFYRPIVWSTVIYLGAAIYQLHHYFELQNNLNTTTNMGVLLSMALTCLMLISIIVNIYYSIKTSVVAFFIEEDSHDNDFGAPKLVDKEQKEKMYRLIALYFAIIIISSFFVNSIILFGSAMKGSMY